MECDCHPWDVIVRLLVMCYGLQELNIFQMQEIISKYETLLGLLLLFVLKNHFFNRCKVENGKFTLIQALMIRSNIFIFLQSSM